MAEGFVEADRETPMLLPADLREWVLEEDLVHFIIEAVKTLPTREFVVNERGTGYAQYPPSMMLALLIYYYANGIFSSRRIERASYRDLGVRYLTGDTHPDHDTLCTFRRQKRPAYHEVFRPGVGIGPRTQALEGGHNQCGWHAAQSQCQ
jgi:transposase